ncbi:MAG: hydrogenase maturation protease [Candidatus Bipolaricaulota bacterium]
MDVVIGIGNELRGDDGVGLRVVRGLPSRPYVTTVAVHQLTPDLAELLSEAERVLFVDAHARATTLQLQAVAPSEFAGGIGHSVVPGTLLAWTAALSGRVPEGWVLGIPAQTFDVGEELSPEAERAVPAARRAVLKWLDRAGDPLRDEEDA